MTRNVVAAVTVGQAPREDILRELRCAVPRTRWIQQGALDQVQERDLLRLAPVAGEFPVVTRLNAVRRVIVGERAIQPLVQKAVDRVGAEANLVIVLCSTPLDIESRVPVLFPDRLLRAAAASLGPGSKIAVLTPHAEQVAFQGERWRERGFAADVICASPYGGTDFSKLGVSLRRSGAAMIVLDCVAYTSVMKASLAESSGLPVVLVRNVLAHAAAEFVNHSSSASTALQSLPFSLVDLTRGIDMESGAARLASKLTVSYTIGSLGPGERVPSVRAMAREFGVSPTTVSEWYKKLQDYELIESRVRSGSFLRSFVPAAREPATFRILRQMLRQFAANGWSAGDVAGMLESCTDDRPPDPFSIGFFMPGELYELVLPDVEKRLGFRLPAVHIAPGDSLEQRAHRLASEGRPIYTVHCTPREWKNTCHFARLSRFVIGVVRLDQKTVDTLYPQDAGIRCIVTRDAAFASTVREWAAAAGPSSRPEATLVTHVENPAISELVGRADHVVVSPAAWKSLPASPKSERNVDLWQVRLAQQTVDELLFAYLAAHAKLAQKH